MNSHLYEMKRKDFKNTTKESIYFFLHKNKIIVRFDDEEKVCKEKFDLPTKRKNILKVNQ